MTHKSKGIVLRTIKYGDTSIIVHIYTELFGIQAYLVNGVRAASKKGPGKANLFQPGAILDLILYHNELKNLQRLKEYKWAYLYKNIFFDVVRNSIALFMIELFHKTLKQPEANEPLFHFIEDALIHLDESSDAVAANFPLYFSLHLMEFSGMKFSDTYSENKQVLDLKEGEFTKEIPNHPHYIDGTLSYLTAQFLRARQPHELLEIKMNKETRRSLLQAYLLFYALQMQDFGSMKTLGVLQTVIS